MRTRFLPSILPLLVALCVAAPAASAQIGVTTDILTGRVTGAGGQAMAGVLVSALSVESGITRTARTGSDGRYTIVFPDGGGEYRVDFRAIGFAPVQRNVARQGDEDRLVTDVALGAQEPPQLATVNVRARRGRPNGRFEPPTPGQTGQTLGADQLNRLPVDQSDLAAIAALAPGVVPVEGTDTTDAAFSVAGQRSTLNNVTLDGLSFGSFSVPQEAVRSTSIITNTYDPSRGQFSGGEIASTTRSGTNSLQGGVTYSRRDPTLEFEGGDSSTFSPYYLQDQISAGLGGPIVKNRLFAFGAAQFRRRSDPFPSLASASPANLSALGVQPDSVAALLTAVSAAGIPAGAGAPSRRVGDQTSALLRVDYLLGNANTLTVRGDYHRRSNDPVRVSSFGLPATGGTMSGSGGGLAVTLTSAFQNGIINEVRAYQSVDATASTGYVALPAARVRLTSRLDSASRGVQVLSLGGNAGLPQQSRTSLFEATDELSYLTSDQAHRIRLGGLLDLTGYRQTATFNQLGTFTFNSLAAFRSNTPASFTRSTGAAQRSGRVASGAVYLADTWRPNDALQLVYGIRAEATRIAGAPALDTAVEQRFGLRTDEFPSEVHVSPRIGFSLNLSKPDPTDPFSRFRPAFLIRGGIGEFRARTPAGLYASAQSATGLPGTESQVECIGPAAPAPDWTTYLGDPSSIPDACASGVAVPPAFASVRPSVTVFDRDFEAPRAWRASLGVQRRLFGLVTGAADASWARGVALYGVRDVNLSVTPAFALADEGNRPVYAPPSAILARTGTVSTLASRVDPAFGQVLELGSGLASDTRQLTLSLGGSTTGGTVFRLAYTLQRTNDQSSFTCCSAAQGFASPTTAGDPNMAQWAPGDMDIRHSIQGFLTRPLTSTLEIAANGRIASGMPFTPLVGSDINGDGARNDRAFIFDPATAPDPAVAAGMRALLASAPTRVRQCLTQQSGRIAARNSCRGPWTPSLDMQLNWRPDQFGLHGNGTISVVAANVLAGLDQLLHGSRLRGWGQYNRVDPTLLYVRGFDPATDRFLYDVNARFGSTAESRTAFRQPFVLALQARITVGPDFRRRFQRIFAARVNDTSAAAQRVQNPVAQILALRDSLLLTPDQVTRLTAVSDTLAARATAIREAIRNIAQKQMNSGPQAMFAAIRPKIAEGRAALTTALSDAKAILTPVQWARVPDEVKHPRILGAAGRRGPGRPPGPRRP